MAKIILCNLEQLNQQAFPKNVKMVDAIAEFDPDEIYISEYVERNLEVIHKVDAEVYLPLSLVDLENVVPDTQIFTDLALYPFYQKAKGLLKDNNELQGVLRFRRKVSDDFKESMIASDLYVISQLLGKPKKVHVRKSNVKAGVSHTILLVNFGQGKMAHLEYTFDKTGPKRIEFEWSGIQHIIDFDSEKFNPIQNDFEPNLTLIYEVDDILSSAVSVDSDFIETINHYRKLVTGGVQ